MMTNTECLIKLFPKITKYTDNDEELTNRLNADKQLTEKLRAYMLSKKAFKDAKIDLTNYSGRIITRYAIINS